jgi:2-haloacid dehalogenase
MATYTWLILDADGTLLDFHRAEAAALDRTLRQMGLEPPPEFSSTFRTINASLWQAFEAGCLRAHDVRTLRFAQLFETLRLPGDPAAFSEAFLTNLVRETRFHDGAESLLTSLRHRVGLVLLTNGFADVQHARIEQLGLQDTFDHVLISEEIGAAKPHRAAFDAAFSCMGHPDRRRVLMVGDSLSSDIRGGEGYGIDTCWFNPGRAANGAAAHPTYEITHLSELVALIVEGEACHGSPAS